MECRTTSRSDTTGIAVPSYSSIGRPPMLPSRSGRSTCSTAAVGSAYSASPDSTSRARVVARVNGKVTVKRVPPVRSDSTSTRPPRRSTLRATTSRPTPRPETSVTSLLVEKPGRKISRSTSRSCMTARSASVARPRSAAAWRTAATFMPAPSSSTSMTVVLPRWVAATITLPIAGLPSRCRSAGTSRPWSSALRSRWSSGSFMSSSARRSISVSDPTRTRRASLPRLRVRSRTVRSRLLVRCPNGSMRKRMTWVCRSSVRPPR